MYNIEIEKPSRLKRFCSRLRRNIEYILFCLLLKIPDKLMPKVAMLWIGNYLEKRNQQLRIQATQLNYNNAFLKKAAMELKHK